MADREAARDRAIIEDSETGIKTRSGTRAETGPGANIGLCEAESHSTPPVIDPDTGERATSST